MSVFLVARLALRESHRGRELPLLLAMYGLLFGLIGALVGFSTDGPEELVAILGAVTALTLPIVGLMLGQPTVAARREDGRLRLLFGQPISRTSLVVGMYLAKALVVVAAFGIGVLATMIVFTAVGGSLDVGSILRFGVWGCLLGLAYLGIAMAFSAASETTRWSTFNMLGLYLALVFVWRLAPHLVLLATNGLSFPETIPPWVDLVSGLSPSVAFERLLGFNGFEFFEASHYLSTEFSLAVLAGWIIVIPLLGILRFRSADL